MSNKRKNEQLFSFKKGASVRTSEFWYDLTDGGYIRPEELLDDAEQVRQVNGAIALLRAFLSAALNSGAVTLD